MEFARRRRMSVTHDRPTVRRGTAPVRLVGAALLVVCVGGPLAVAASAPASATTPATVAAPVAAVDAAQSVAVDPTTGTAWAVTAGSGGGHGSLVPISGVDGSVGAPVAVGSDPTAVAVDPVRGTVYVADGGSDHALTVVQDGVVVRTVDTLGIPRGVAVDPATGTAYVTVDPSSVHAGAGVDAVPSGAGAVSTQLGLGGGPTGIAVDDVDADPADDQVWVAARAASTVEVLDAALTGVGATIPVGTGPVALAVDRTSGEVVVADGGASSVSVLRGHAVVATVAVGGTPKGIGVDPSTGTVYVATGCSGNVVAIGEASAAVDGGVQVGGTSAGLDVDPAAHRVFVTNSTTGVVSVLDEPSVGGSPTPATIGTPYAYQLALGGSPAPSASSPGGLPPGMALSGGGQLSGTPTEAGIYVLTVVASNGVAPTATLTFDLTVGYPAGPAPPPPPGHPGPNGPGTSGPGLPTTDPPPVVPPPTVHHGTGDPGTGGRSSKLPFTPDLSVDPRTGAPGQLIEVRDTNLVPSLARCPSIDVYFDHQLMDQVRPTGIVLEDRIVVPGYAATGVHHVALACGATGASQASFPFLVHASGIHFLGPGGPGQGAGALVPGWHRFAAALGLAALMLFLVLIYALGFPADWFNETYDENKERIRQGVRRKVPWLVREERDRATPLGRFLTGSAVFAVFLGLSGILYASVDPGFSWHWSADPSAPLLLLADCVGIAVVTLGFQIPRIVVGVERHHRLSLNVLAGSVVVGVACVIVSKSLHLDPGYVYGLIAVFAFTPTLDERTNGRLVAACMTTVLVLSVVAFVLWEPGDAGGGSGPGPLVFFVQQVLLFVWAAGIQSVCFAMLPLPFLPGREILRWNKVAWAAILGTGLVVFSLILLEPGGPFEENVGHRGLIPALVTFGLFALVSLGFMAYFRFTDPRTRSDEPGAGPGQVEEPVTVG